MGTQLIEPQSPRLAGADERRLSIVEHLEELRKRLWICAAVILVASLGSATFAGALVEWLKRPAGSLLPRLAFFSPPEAFVAHLKVAVTAGLILSLPIILHELWMFIRPGLTRRERTAGLAFVWWGSALFTAGGAFAYWVVLPVCLRFLLAFGGSELEAVISISRYLSFATMVIVACGAMFELPLAVWLLTASGVITPQWLRRHWRHAVVGVVVAAALLTPTADVATMILLAVPMLALYELSIWIASAAAPRKAQDV